MLKYFLTQVKRTSGNIEKGCVVKDTIDEARQAYHAYLGAYAFGNNQNTDYVLVSIMDSAGGQFDKDVWDKTNVEEQTNE